MERDETVKKIVIIDADSLIYRSAYSVKDSRNEELGKAAINDHIYRILRETKATHYMGFAQSKSYNFRYDIYKDYKANRKPSEDWVIFWKPVMLDVMHNQWGFSDPTPHAIESDDAMAIAFNRLSSIYDSKEEIIMAFIDKDLCQINSESSASFIWYDYMHNSWFNVRKERAHLFRYRQIIAGDSSDNIKGIPRKGAKFAEKLLDPIQTNERAMFFATYREYIKHFGLENARREYTVVRDCIQLLKEKDGFELPEVRKVPNIHDKIEADILNI